MITCAKCFKCRYHTANYPYHAANYPRKPWDFDSDTDCAFGHETEREQPCDDFEKVENRKRKHVKH